MDGRLTIENLREGQPVAWNGGDPDYEPIDLFIGHPGRIRSAAGADLFVDWYLRASESAGALDVSDVDAITEEEYTERVAQLEAGLPPAAQTKPTAATTLHSDEPGSEASAARFDRERALRAILTHLLRGFGEFPGRAELLKQAGEVEVTGGPATFTSLQVRGDWSGPAAVDDGPLPGFASVENPDGESIGTLIVWVKGGYLSGLEYAWSTGTEPRALPRTERIRFDHT